MCGIAGIVDYENERQTMKTGSGMIALYRWCMRG